MYKSAAAIPPDDSVSSSSGEEAGGKRASVKLIIFDQQRSWTDIMDDREQPTCRGCHPRSSLSWL